MKGTKPKLVISNEAVTKTPAPPSWLSVDAKKEWRRIMPTVVRRRILTTADLGSVENYCICIGTAREAERHLQKHGHVYEAFKDTEDGPVCIGMKRNPSSLVLKDAIAASRQLAAELGLTPVSRSRPSIREDDDDDGLNPLDIS
ncbi:phage terminase small subunit P27 family [Aliihoeflea aestuarii]|jgi:P27 family predicted phage terminase small subunit|uniref:phage terminase small subunit P27 family n=1 Tax=Aliihoeflea aestuarii TaxID=453840 RepID=UPI00209305FC|nr:phage terminase small subunit P27 family [Aliihoeflea aestuarii]MCO6390559.1 phage terminase small subunit P27 family [Aliihoeflea aestuarii]